MCLGGQRRRLTAPARPTARALVPDHQELPTECEYAVPPILPALALGLAATSCVVPPGPVPPTPPAASGHPFPTAEITGVPAGVQLKSSGSVTVSQAGQVIDALNVNGTITINADNVTIKRTRVTTKPAMGIKVNGRNATIVDVDVVGTANSCGAAIGYGNYTARRVDVSGCADGLKVSGNVLVEDSYIHDQRKFSGVQNDGIQASQGSHVVLRHNTISGPYRQSNAALMFGTTLGPIDDIVVENNHMSGGGYLAYFVNQNKGFGAPTVSD